MRKSLWLVLIAALALSALATVPRASSASDQPPPNVLETSPSRGQELLVDGVVTFFFDQPMDRVSVEGAFLVIACTDDTETNIRISTGRWCPRLNT